jgi:Ca2+-transporting ATPase
MSTVHEMAPGSLLLAVKGSPAEVLRRSRWVVVNGERRPLGDAEREAILAANETMAGEALRVLGVAYATIDGPAAAPEEDGLTWLGLVGLADPLRAGARELIAQFHDAGIQTIMITGDQSATACAIGRELRLSGNDHLDILDSTHLEMLDPEVLKGLAGRVHVFARVSPAHKLKIVQALQQAGKVVGMTGDGINDGPALRAADIGVAMGAAGTDVARQVADVVLEDDDLQTMIVAVSQGRTIYHNIRKSVHFLLATNLSEILVMFGAVAAGMGQPLTPMQLLWINLVSDIFPAIGLALEPPEPDVLRRPPRDPGEPIVRPRDLERIGFEAVTISAGSLAAYGYGVARYGAGPAAGTIAFASLTGAQLLHAISARSEHHSVFDRGQLPANPALYAALGGTAALSLGALFAPGLRRFLGSAPLAPLALAVSAAGAAVPFLVNETTKSLGRVR